MRLLQTTLNVIGVRYLISRVDGVEQVVACLRTHIPLKLQNEVVESNEDFEKIRMALHWNENVQLNSRWMFHLGEVGVQMQICGQANLTRCYTPYICRMGWSALSS